MARTSLIVAGIVGSIAIATAVVPQASQVRTALAPSLPGPPLSSPAPAAPAAGDAVMAKLVDGHVVTLANADIRLGVDLHGGGAITYLSRADADRNVVNNHDPGRQIQQSYYSGPHPFGNPTGVWANAGWNPVATGDAFLNPNKAVTHEMSGGVLHVRTRPYQWALRTTRCDCTFDQWITLRGNTVHVRQRLTNRRVDTRQYPAEDQELPAVYLNGFLRNARAYTGSAPYRGGAVATLPSPWPYDRIDATEHWAAFVDDAGWGVGVISPETTTFKVGFAGPRRDGGTTDNQTAYLAPTRRDVLDHDIEYETSYALVLGTMTQIRAAARRMRPADDRPDYVFEKERHGWSYVNASDGGWPVPGRITLTVTQSDPQIFGPDIGFAADDVPALFVRAAFHGTGDSAQLFWSTPRSQAYSEANSVHFPVLPDGVMRSYRIPLAGVAGWHGRIRSLRLDPPGDTGSRVELCAISWRARTC